MLLLRVGVAFAFLYPPIAALFDFYSWIGYFPQFMRGIVPDAVLLHGFGLIEVVIALWILFGKRILIPATAATAILALIVLFDWNQLDVIFRDISIGLMSLALVFFELEAKTSSAA